MKLQARIYRGDITKVWKGNVPFKDTNGNIIGEIVSVMFDGEYTVATAEIKKECEHLLDGHHGWHPPEGTPGPLLQIIKGNADARDSLELPFAHRDVKITKELIELSKDPKRDTKTELQEDYETWPQEVKDQFWKNVKELLMWRGWLSIGQIRMSSKLVHNIAELFLKHSQHDVEQYT